MNMPSMTEAHHSRCEIGGGKAPDGWLEGSAGEALEVGARWATLGRQRGVAEKVGVCVARGGLDGLDGKQSVLAVRLLETEWWGGVADALVGRDLLGRKRGGAMVGHVRMRGGAVVGHVSDGWWCRL